MLTTTNASPQHYNIPLHINIICSVFAEVGHVSASDVKGEALKLLKGAYPSALSMEFI
ncbi:MAG: hypothetical protein L7H04_06480 [Vulcanisaeta sp.]|nr:hypothetical protein [Vulcanisaeta sp.]